MNDDDFLLCSLMIKAALWSRRLAMGLEENPAEKSVDEQEMEIIISGLVDAAIHAIQEYHSCKNTWEKFQMRYAVK